MVNPKMTPVAKLGDLVNITGYSNRLFRVDSYTHEFTFEHGINSEDIYYDCTCVTAGEYTLGSQEDLTVLCAKEDADEFMKTYEHPEVDVKAMDIFDGMFGNIFGEEAEVMSKPTKTEVKAKRPLTKQQRIDAYLDELINVNNAIELIGDDGELAFYAARKAGIIAGMKALEGGR